jgi:hypothetical protein
MEKTGKIPTSTINYIGKYATIKKEVKLPIHEKLTQIHNYQYKIVNQNRRRTWICLESHIFVTYTSRVSNKSKHDVINKSFWMKVDECEINDLKNIYESKIHY